MVIDRQTLLQCLRWKTYQILLHNAKTKPKCSGQMYTGPTPVIRLYQLSDTVHISCRIYKFLNVSSHSERLVAFWKGKSNNFKFFILHFMMKKWHHIYKSKWWSFLMQLFIIKETCVWKLVYFYMLFKPQRYHLQTKQSFQIFYKN